MELFTHKFSNGIEIKYPDYPQDEFDNDATERNLILDAYNRNPGMVIDIGAHVGYVSIPLMKDIPSHHFMLFEPSPNTMNLLLLNLHINNFNPVVYPYAVGSIDGVVEFYESKELKDAHFNGLEPNIPDMTIIPIQLFQLDTLISLALKISFIKIDTEGFDNEVLLGALNLIRHNKPEIFVEVFETTSDQIMETYNTFLKDDYEYQWYDWKGKMKPNHTFNWKDEEDYGYANLHFFPRRS